MGLRFFSDKDRPVHMGPYPAERLARAAAMPDLTRAPVFAPLDFRRAATPESIVNAMAEYQVSEDAALNFSVASLTDATHYDAFYRSGSRFVYGAPGGWRRSRSSSASDPELRRWRAACGRRARAADCKSPKAKEKAPMLTCIPQRLTRAEVA